MDSGSFTNRIVAEGCHFSVGGNQKQVFNGRESKGQRPF